MQHFQSDSQEYHFDQPAQPEPESDIIPKVNIYQVLTTTIRCEKIRALTIIFWGILIFLWGLFYLTSFLFRKLAPGLYLFDLNDFFVLTPFISVPMVLVGVFFMIYNFSNFNSINKEIFYYLEKKKYNPNAIPQFVIDILKRSTTRVMVENWVFIPLYFLVAAILGILSLLQKFHGRDFSLGFWTIGKIPDLKKAMMILIIVISSKIILHFIIIILNKWRRDNLTSYFGSDLMLHPQIIAWKKTVRQRVIWTWIWLLIIIFAVVMIPILWLKKSKSKSFIWRFPWTK